MDAQTAVKRTLAILGLSAAMASALGKQALSVSPNPATADKAFVLYLQGLETDCYTVFARESVTVTGNRIDLRYTSQSIILPSDPPTKPATCPIPLAATVDGSAATSPILPNLPLFSMPALAAGKYEVWASDVPECVYSGCKIAIQTVSAGTLEVRQAAAPSYTFTPASAAAGQAFDLHLLSYGFTCATIYEDKVVHVVGDVITLSFSSREPTGVACPAVYMPYGPVFKMPALAAGNYRVQVDRNMLNAPPVVSGSLQVTVEEPRKGWYLGQKTVQADAPFQMRLWRYGLPSCPTFSDVNALVSGSGIQVSFLPVGGGCDTVATGPAGPVIAMPALKTGAYPIYVTELLPCEVGIPMCVVEREMTLPSDTLLVVQTLALRMSALRAGAPAMEFSGKTLRFALPEGRAGAWRAELMALDGRVLARKSLQGAPGDRVSLDVDRAPAKAVTLLRLTPPAGAPRYLPIVR